MGLIKSHFSCFSGENETLKVPDLATNKITGIIPTESGFSGYSSKMGLIKSHFSCFSGENMM
jgi:hypothetical protein